jgi:hypothetical protein
MTMARTALTHPLTAALVDGGKARDDAIRTIRAALKTADGKLVLTAKVLGVSRDTVIRLVRDAGLLDYGRDLREQAGIKGPRTARSDFQGRVKRPRRKS